MSRKIDFYREELKRPVGTDSNGVLDDESVFYEAALILAKENRARDLDILESLKESINRSSPEAQIAIKNRAIVFFPSLQGKL